jgi:2-amino-4-hydroxy-6-hydroxymethyldihydropteridine diphosphokinase
LPEPLFLTLGSNIEPERHLSAAIARLDSVGRILAISNVYQNPAIGPRPEQDFLNVAVLLDTELPLAEIRARLRQIESSLGRVRSADKYAARPIDIDVSLLGSQIIDAADVRLPDPDILKRPYVAVPLAELAPRFRHPLTGHSLAAIANRLRGSASLTLRRDVTTRLQGLLAPADSRSRPEDDRD